MMKAALLGLVGFSITLATSAGASAGAPAPHLEHGRAASGVGGQRGLHRRHADLARRAAAAALLAADSREKREIPGAASESTGLERREDGDHQLAKRSFTGVGTFYNAETGQAGACGSFIKNTDWSVALKADMYGDLGQVSSYCYKKITIQANGKTANGVPIVDACPGCQGPGGLDMTPGLFSYFIDQSAGVVPITWWVEDGSNDGSASSSSSSSPKQTTYYTPPPVSVKVNVAPSTTWQPPPPTTTWSSQWTPSSTWVAPTSTWTPSSSSSKPSSSPAYSSSASLSFNKASAANASTSYNSTSSSSVLSGNSTVLPANNGTTSTTSKATSGSVESTTPGALAGNIAQGGSSAQGSGNLWTANQIVLDIGALVVKAEQFNGD